MMMMTGLTMDSGNEPEMVTGYTEDEAGKCIYETSCLVKKFSFCKDKQ